MDSIASHSEVNSSHTNPPISASSSSDSHRTVKQSTELVKYSPIDSNLKSIKAELASMLLNNRSIQIPDSGIGKLEIATMALLAVKGNRHNVPALTKDLVASWAKQGTIASWQQVSVIFESMTSDYDFMDCPYLVAIFCTLASKKVEDIPLEIITEFIHKILINPRYFTDEGFPLSPGATTDGFLHVEYLTTNSNRYSHRSHIMIAIRAIGQGLIDCNREKDVAEILNLVNNMNSSLYKVCEDLCKVLYYKLTQAGDEGLLLLLELIEKDSSLPTFLIEKCRDDLLLEISKKLLNEHKKETGEY